MKISVIGCGYLGAVHAAAMATLGHDVIGIDTDSGKIEKLSKGIAPFFEPGLESILINALESGTLRFSTRIETASDAVVHFIAVGTPQTEQGLSADVSYVNAAVDALLPILKPGDLIVGKSTVPVGTTSRLADVIASSGTSASIAWNPEFLREGFAIQDTISPDRLVYGVTEKRQVDVLDEVYAQAITSGIPRIVTDFATAELVKVAANAFLATKISFINAMAEIAELTGADVTHLANALGHDARIGRRFLNAGVGFGGGCLPKDIRAFAARADELGSSESLLFLKEIDAINLRQRQRLVERAVGSLNGSVNEKKITVLGVTFKPDSDDVRDSPALDIAVQLKGLGARVVATDPQGIENARLRHPQLAYEPDIDKALSNADLVILVTEWADYRELDPVRIKSLVKCAIILDGRNALEPKAWRSAGWDYRGVGRPDTISGV